MSTFDMGAVRHSLSRRSFVKAGALTAVAALGASSLSGCAGMHSVEEAEVASETVAYTYHPMNCGNRCSLKCTVRDGRLCHIQGNQWQGPESKFSICCFKGMSEIQRVYSPDRIQTPLRRTGERGSGEFEAISWDEALKTIADAIKKTQKKNGKNSVLFTNSSSIDYPMPLLRTLLGAQGIEESGIDMAQGNGFDPVFGDAVVGIMTKEVTDWVNAKTIILVGVNPLETGLTLAQCLIDAKKAGARLIVVDPMHTATASKADQWIPIKPGNDSALYLGMATAILENKWYDEEHMRAYTNLPFLVGDDGMLLREREVKEGDTGETNPYLVWDEKTKQAAAYNAAGVRPALEGTYEVNGKKATTAFTLYKKGQVEHTVEWASKLTGIDQDVIVELARTYAQDGPAFLNMGFGGADKYSNADVTGHAAAMLAALTGNIGKKGTGLGIIYSFLVSEGAPALGGWSLPEEFAMADLEMQTPLMRTNPSAARVVINHGNSLVQHLGNWTTTKAWLDTLDLVVTIDPYFCDSANYSDIVLPGTTCFEMRDANGNVQVNKNHVLIQQKVIEPLFDSKTDFEIEHELGVLLGFEKYLPKSNEEVARLTLTTDDPQMKGIDYDTLMANKGLMRLDVSDEPFDSHANHTFATPSGRIEAYQEVRAEFGQALPHYENSIEAYPDNPLREKYPLQFWQTRRKYYVHSQFQNSTWISQVIQPGIVHMAPEDAAGRGISDGDTIRIFNDRGEVEAVVAFDNSLMPGSVVLSDGAWSRDTGRENFETLINDTLIERPLMYGAPIPFYDTLVEVAKA